MKQTKRRSESCYMGYTLRSTLNMQWRVRWSVLEKWSRVIFLGINWTSTYSRALFSNQTEELALNMFEVLSCHWSAETLALLKYVICPVLLLVIRCRVMHLSVDRFSYLHSWTSCIEELQSYLNKKNKFIWFRQILKRFIINHVHVIYLVFSLLCLGNVYPKKWSGNRE